MRVGIKVRFLYLISIIGIAVFLVQAVVISCKKIETERVLRVETDSVSNISHKSCILYGTIIDLGESPISQHGHCWSISSTPTVGDSFNQLDGVDSTGSFSSHLDNLQENTKYYFRSYAINEQNIKYGSELTFSTDKLVIAPTVSTGEPYDIQRTTAVVSGYISSHGSSTVVQHGHCFSINHNPTVDDDNTSELGYGTVDSFTTELLNLKSNTTYYYKAYARNNEDISYGEELSFITLADNVEFSEISINSVSQFSSELSITIYSDGGNDILKRGFCLIENNEGILPKVDDANVFSGNDIGTFEVTIKDLLPNRDYIVRGYAITEIDTFYSNYKNLHTLGFLEGWIQDDRPGGITYNTVKIGNQWWMKEDLNYPSADTRIAGSVYYLNNPEMYGYMGRYYSWASALGIDSSYNYTIADPVHPVQGMCPEGWHVPSDEDWKELEIYLGMNQHEADGTGSRGTNQGLLLADEFVLALSYSGVYLFLEGNNNDFWGIEEEGWYWTATESDKDHGVFRAIYSTFDQIYRDPEVKDIQHKVRCVKDD